MPMIARAVFALIFILISCVVITFQALAEDEYRTGIKAYPYRHNDLMVIGEPVSHLVQTEDTFLDIAREYGLGFSEMVLLYPKTDPWMPPDGKPILLPTSWVLPHTEWEQLVINVPELRLYFFQKSRSRVQTYPVALGDKDWQTPLGTFFINEKRPNPTWYIPKSLQKERGLISMPHGPGNPMGKFMMKFSAGAFAIHGTHVPWGVGRLVSHGCVRCYPEHIRLLYPQVPVRTKLEIIYKPIKFGRKGRHVFVEVHPDVYDRIPDFERYAELKLKRYPMAVYVDEKKYRRAVLLKSGVPTDVSLCP